MNIQKNNINVPFYSRLSRKGRESYLNLPTFLGLLNTDGNISFIIASNGTFKPRIILSAQVKRQETLIKFKKFMHETYNVSSHLDVSQDTSRSRATNLVIDRIDNVTRFLEAVNRDGSINGKPILFGRALRSLLVVQCGLQLNQAKRAGRISSNLFLLKLIDLKDKMRQEALSSVFKTREDFEINLGFNPNESLHSADAEWNKILQTANEHESILINNTKEGVEHNTCRVKTNTLLSFVCGVMAGDGSYQVNLLTNRNHGPAFNYRKPLEFKILITITDLAQQDREKPPLFHLIEKCLGVSAKYNKEIEQGNRACRLVISKQKDLMKVMDYMLKFEQPFLETEKRLRFTALTLALLKRLNRNKDFAALWIKFIYNAPYLIKNRRKTFAEVINILYSLPPC